MLKRASDFDKEKMEDPSVEEIKHLKDPEKAAAIVDSFNKISQEYDEIMTESIKVPPIPKETIPTFTPLQIKKYLDRVKTNKATLPGEIPAKIVKLNSDILCTPMAHMINQSIKQG